MEQRYIDRFWEQVNKSRDGCWEWTGAIAKQGYGLQSIHNIRVYVHRISWEIHFGEIPAGMFVCHHCDNRKCIRPDHLFLGTVLDNFIDMMQKGIGKCNNRAKLNAEQVKKIREEYASGSRSVEIAERYSMSRQAISAVVFRHNWKHVI